MELTIEKLIYGGEGLGRLPADEKGRGKAVFVPFTLPGEKVEIAVREEKPGFARAAATRILEASPLRVAAACPYFQSCGGCQYQHADYQQQLEIKAAILKENLRRLARMELSSALQVHASPPWNYRNRARMQVHAGSEFALGYFKAASHELQPVETCPISSPLLNGGIEALWRMGRGGHVPQELREVELFANEDDSLLQIELYIDGRATGSGPKQGVQTLAEDLRAELPQVESIYVFPQLPMRGVQGPTAAEPVWTRGAGEFRYRTKAGALRVSGGSFFQVNRFLVEELVKIVTGGRAGDLALDLYAGVGLFSVALAASFRHIVAVESSQGSAADLKYNSARNMKAVRSSVDAYLAGQGAKVRPDLVVVDPPRAGLGERVARGIAQMGAPRVTYVSCDPATLARDLVTLTGAGYRVEQAHLVDLFPQTYHIESVVEFVR